GARAVEVGTACFMDPLAPLKIIDGINTYLDRHGESDINSIVGIVKR
ncbi:MAG TPA: dihydroorotate dehydrogenase, partial [candidate division Zixibacteria bacterium]|nr:dihydroorotate dehydrogenase [candidate division Zixibacteria bacterium]